MGAEGVGHLVRLPGRSKQPQPVGDDQQGGALVQPDGHRIKPSCGGFGVAEAGAGHGQLEHLDDLGAEEAGEAGVAADGGLTGDATLLVSGRAKGR